MILPPGQIIRTAIGDHRHPVIFQRVPGFGLVPIPEERPPLRSLADEAVVDVSVLGSMEQCILDTYAGKQLS